MVHGDSAMFVGGLRALLLQSLHPLAMAGVAQHSNYRDDEVQKLIDLSQSLQAVSHDIEVEEGATLEVC